MAMKSLVRAYAVSETTCQSLLVAASSFVYSVGKLFLQSNNQIVMKNVLRSRFEQHCKCESALANACSARGRRQHGV